MKVLALMPYSPVPPTFGGALRMYHILRWMMRRFEVTLFMLGTGRDAELVHKDLGLPFDRMHVLHASPFFSDRWKRVGQVYALVRNTSYAAIAHYNRTTQHALDRLVKTEKFDLIVLFFSAMGFYRLDTDAICVLDAPNIEYDIYKRIAESGVSLGRRWWSQVEYRKLHGQEVTIWERQDAILVTSDRDRNYLRRDVTTVPTHVIPNGVDTEYFRVSDDPAEPHSLVFTGAINYVPNADGVVFFVNEVLPLVRRAVPDVKFYIVGNAPPESVRRLASDNVIITGFVEDVRPYVARAGVFVVPLRSGGGTRLKVLEAMSMRRPIVTTAIGAEGIDVVDGESVLMADSPGAFADSIVRLMDDPSLRKALVSNGDALVHAQYDWGVIGEQLDRTFAEILRGHTQKKAR